MCAQEPRTTEFKRSHKKNKSFGKPTHLQQWTQQQGARSSGRRGITQNSTNCPSSPGIDPVSADPDWPRCRGAQFLTSSNHPALPQALPYGIRRLPAPACVYVRMSRTHVRKYACRYWYVGAPSHVQILRASAIDWLFQTHARTRTQTNTHTRRSGQSQFIRRL